jgi:TetR/AcrR family transcriptional regulator, lmrAB and yxaGH operons repressor
MTRAMTTRERLVQALVHLLSERRYDEVTLSDIAARARAPMPSIYRHAAGGKEGLAVEVASRARGGLERYAERVASRTDDPVSFLLAVVDDQSERMARADFRMLCPLTSLGLALEGASGSERLRIAVGEVLVGWAAAVARGLHAKGLEGGRAERVATAFVAYLQGALIVTWATRNTHTLHQLGWAVPILLGGAA